MLINSITLKIYIMKRFLHVIACVFGCVFLLPALSYSQSYPGFPESFDGSTFPPSGWSVNLWSYSGSDGGGCGCVDWQYATSYGGVEPQEPTHSGSGMAWYNSWDIYSGNESALESPTFDLTSYSTGTDELSFWMFRSYDIGGSWYGNEDDWIDVYAYDPSYGYEYISTIYDGINNYPSLSSEGWYQYTYTIPSTLSSYSNVSVIFDAVSDYAVDMYLDDVSVDHIPPPVYPCSGVPDVTINTVPAICENIPFTLDATTDPTPVSGMTYQWESASSSAGPWTAIPGATDPSYTTSITSLTYFKCVAYCSNSGLYGESNIDETDVTPVPSIPTIGSNSPVCEGVSHAGNKIILSATDLVPGVKYTWSGPNGYYVADDPSPTQTIPDPPLAAAGTYTVYASLNGCSSGTNSTNVVVNPTPSAPVVSPNYTAYCQNDAGAVALTATGTGVMWYTASSGGVGSSTAPTPDLTNAGLFLWYVTQTVAGCESAATIDTVLVKTKPATPYTNPALTYCQGEIAPQLTAIGANLLWYSSAAGGSGSSVPPTPSTGVAGTFNYYVSQTVNGCESDRQKIEVIIKPKPAKPTAASKNYCQGEFSLPLTASGSNLIWYRISSGGLGSTVPPTPITAYADTLYYYVTQTVNGCESDRTEVTVVVDYTPNALIVADKPYVCQYDSTFFTYFGNALPNAIYNWTMPTGATLLSGNIQGPVWVKFDSAGKLVVSLQVTNKRCKSPVTNYIVDVRPAPFASTNIKHEVCQGDVLDVRLGYPNEAIDKYDWSFDGADIVYGDGAGTYGIRWNTSGEHIINFTAYSKTCPSIPIHDTVTVHPLADAHVGTTSGSNICAGDSVMFTAERYNPAYLYQWQPSAYFGTQNNKGQVYGFIQHTGYVKLSVTTQYGCTSTDSTLLTAQPCCEVFFPNAFTPNKDGKNDVFRPVTKGNQIIKTFFVTDRWGQKVFETVNPQVGWDGKYNGADQDLGTYYYFIRYVCANGKVFEEKGEVLLIR